MELYKVVTDRQLLIDFIKTLPEYVDGEKAYYYLCLFARKKYAPEVRNIKSDKCQLERCVTTPKRILNELEKWEVPLGRYIQFGSESNTVVPQEALAVYITPNPRSTVKAAPAIAKRMIDHLAGQEVKNLIQETTSVMQRSKLKTLFVDFDIDYKSIPIEDIKFVMSELLHPVCYKILETRGGYHLLVEPEKARHYNKGTNWYKQIKESLPVDQTGDQMIPIPGTYQGGFTPKFI